MSLPTSNVCTGDNCRGVYDKSQCAGSSSQSTHQQVRPGVAAGVEGELLAFPGFPGPDGRHLGDFAVSDLPPLPSAAASSSAPPTSKRKRRNAIDYGKGTAVIDYALTGDSHYTPNSGLNPAKRWKGKGKADVLAELPPAISPEPHEPLARADTPRPPRSPPIAYTPASSPTLGASHHDVQDDAARTAELEGMMARIELEVRERREMRHQQGRPHYVERYPRRRNNDERTMSL